ncbi:MAG: ATP-binding protein [Shimia sp.]|uniref:ATP-binding protein n=1 Tax=Shimia sp. TaxID=1954381 RepID=UPI00405821C8
MRIASSSPILSLWRHLTRGLARRMLVYFGALITFCVAVLIYSNTMTQQDLVEQRFKQRAESLGHLILEVSLPYLFDGHPSELDVIYEELEDQPEILALSFVDSDGRLIVSGAKQEHSLFLGLVDDPLVNQAQVTRDVAFRKLDGLIEVAIPVIYGNFNFGTIRVDLDGMITVRETQLVRQRNMLFGLLFIVAGLGMSFFTARRLTGPRAELTKATEKAAAGNLDHRIAIHTNDEVESLASSFNAMMDHLAERVQKLELTKEQLKAFSDELHEKNQQLHTAVETAQNAENAENAKPQFLARMSHEIRIPMNGVLGMAELLSDSELTAAQRGLLDSMNSSGSSLLNIINDILDFSKIDSGHMTVRKDVCKPIDIIEKTAQILAFQASDAGVDLITRVDPALPDYILGDTPRLKQIIINLAGNALKFTDEGYVTIDARLAKGDDGTPLIQFNVCDTGVGIPAENLATVFDQFTQVDGSYSRKHQGTGLGLAISKGFVELMGGKIWATSRMGKGSTFSFALPIYEPTDEGVPEIEAVDLKNLRVLVVQKEPMAQFATNEQLTHWGALPDAMGDGGTALKALKSATQDATPFDMVLVESKLPDMSATTFLQACRSLNGIEQPRVVFINELRDSVGIAFDIDAAPDAELQKPILAGNLLRAVRSDSKNAPLKRWTSKPLSATPNQRRTNPKNQS